MSLTYLLDPVSSSYSVCQMSSAVLLTKEVENIHYAQKINLKIDFPNPRLTDPVPDTEHQWKFLPSKVPFSWSMPIIVRPTFFHIILLFAPFFSFQAECMLQNASECLKPGGYFIGTTPDSFDIVQRIRKNGEDANSAGNSIYSVDDRKIDLI